MRRTSAYRGFARTIDSLACQALRATTCGAPTEAVEAERHARDRAPDRQRPRPRDPAARPHLDGDGTPDPDRSTLAPRAGAPALEAAGVRAFVLVLPRRPPRRPAAGIRPRPHLDAARSEPVHADELERSRRSRRTQGSLAAEGDLTHLERGETGARRGREGEHERAEQEKTTHGEAKRDARRLLRQGRRPSPHAMLTSAGRPQTELATS